MDIHACIQQLTNYTPTDGPPPLSALHQLCAAAEPARLIALGEAAWPLIQSLAAAAPRVPGEWDRILDVLRALLDDASVPWPHRAFVLRSLPAMLPDAADADRQRRGEALCATLVQWSLPPAMDSIESGAERERRVAQTALLSFPPDFAAGMAHALAAELPRAADTCAALLAHSAAPDALRAEFEERLPSQEPPAEWAPIEAALRTHFRAFGAAACAGRCGAVIAAPSASSPAALSALGAALSALRAAAGRSAAAMAVAESRLSSALLVTRAAEALDGVAGAPNEALEVLRALAEWGDRAARVARSVAAKDAARLAAPVLAIASRDDALDAPLPIVECALRLLLCALPAALDADEEEEKEVNGEALKEEKEMAVGTLRQTLSALTHAAAVLLPVVDDAALTIRSAMPLLPEKGERRETARRAMHVSMALAQLCRVAKRCMDVTDKRAAATRIAEAAKGVTPSWKRTETSLEKPSTPRHAGGGERVAQPPRRPNRGGKRRREGRR